jgi:hypothetical protein
MHFKHGNIMTALAAKYLLQCLLVRTALCVLFLLMFGTWVPAQEIDVPVSLQTELFLKILAFERNHHDITTHQTTIAIVYQSRYRISLETRNEIVRTIQQKTSNTVRVIDIDLDNSSLTDAVQQMHPHMLFVCPLRSIAVSEIVSCARSNHVLTGTFMSEYVEQGLCLGIQLEQNRPAILVNMEAARAEQANFDSRFLKLAHLITP